MATKRKTSPSQTSAFATVRIQDAVRTLAEDIADLYREDAVPWVVGYSGGKDSTAVLQLVWTALRDVLAPEERTKPVHVISTDTMVENPIVAAWVAKSLETMRQSAEEQGLPIHPHRLTPKVSDSFWVNLIGRGYPSPRHKFRWCTERLKINPSNAFIRSVVRESGETILVLGSRKKESATRARHFRELDKGRVRDRLRPNGKLPNSLVYTPIEDWTNDDVWLYLMQVKNPWGYDNKDLLTMYQGASEDSECPLVVDTTTPSCGDSRFGCWVCTMVDKDRSMTAMIQNDEEKEWMQPLLALRDELGEKDDRHMRDFRRMSGTVQIFHGKNIPGPYTQEVREHWLRQVLQCQQDVRELGPPSVRDIELITLEELEEIRRIWVVDKHEFEDILPAIYTEETGRPYPGGFIDDGYGLGVEEVAILKDICKDDRIHFQLVRELISVERNYRTMARRAGLFQALEKSIKRHFYKDEEDGVERALEEKTGRERAARGEYVPGQNLLPVDFDLGS